MSKLFKQPLLELRDYEGMEDILKKGKGPVQVSGCLDSQKVHLMSQLGDHVSYRLVVTYSELRAKEIYEDFKLFSDRVFYYPAKDFIFYSADIQSNQLVRQRMYVIKNILESKGGVIITTIDGLMNALPPFDCIKNQTITLEEMSVVDLEEMKRKLTLLGYERMAQVEEPGQFAIHGGILDIFCMTEENPFRIELWDDEVDSIRTFDVESQRSMERMEQAVIYPAQEMILTEELCHFGMERMDAEFKHHYQVLKNNRKLEEAGRLREAIEEIKEELEAGIRFNGLDNCIRYFYPETVSFLDYISEESSVVFLDEPVRLKERSEAVEAEFRESMANRLEKGYLLPGQTDILYSTKRIFSKLQRTSEVVLNGLDQKLPFLKIPHHFSLAVQNISSYKNSFELLIQDLKTWKKEGYRVVMLCGSRLRAERLAKDLREYELRAYYAEDQERSITDGEILVTYGNLHRGFSYPQIKFIIITDGDIFGAEKKKRKKKSVYQGQKINSFAELSVGDYVVHENHGLGIYRGIEKVEIDHTIKDYIKIEYGDGGNLYIPATQFHLIQKYADAKSKKPKLNHLGGQEWAKTKKRVKGAVREIAKELVELYAARQNGSGYQYGEDTIWQKEFEEMFPYEETQDQLDAIEATKHDMESKKIMDRLVCGDVGFGKTEIAIRAAFKAVQESKQVVYLVPTTILAQQHYNTFCQRMKDFPVKIELLSRFRTPAQQKKALEGLKKGLVDIIIGTHRVLSKDVVFKDLGLLIIDEEQRFGVTHKEKIKQMKKNVDVLTLTATPIPRTLHMSLIGVRDMSVLEEAPSERHPIQTYVMEYNTEMVREAINRELAREGQVYYVYNRVQDIADMAGKIAKLVPEANVAFAHGQMQERELERIMLDFINGEIDVLVSTTIIETGLDISNVNTIIIHDADRYGLSQLYQLRGRVGRSNRMAYAFIMYKKDKILREEAEKRLQAIREFTELGSGIKIAMRDLEIRGAGSLLGEKQSGHMEAVGYDLYCKMLNEAVRLLKGEEVENSDFDTTVDISMDAYIPSSYIRNEYIKLDMYKRIAAVENEEECMDIQDELIDRFGDIPKAVQNLLSVSLIRVMAHHVYATEVSGNKQEIKITMYQRANINVENIPKLLEKYKGVLTFTAAEEPYFTYVERKKVNKDMDAVLNTVKILLNDIKILLVS